MKICIIAGLFIDSANGGGEKYVQDIARKLAEHDEIVVITTSPHSKFKPTCKTNGNIKIYTFKPIFSIYKIGNVNSLVNISRAILSMVGNVWNVHSYLVVKRILKYEKPDVVHTNNIDHVSTSVITAIKSLKIPCVHTCHSYQLLSVWPSFYNYRSKKIITTHSLYDNIYMIMRRYFTRNIDVVTAPSNFVLELHQKYSYFKKAKTIVLPLGIDLTDVPNISKDYKTINILYVGRLVTSKGVHVLINAFKELEFENIQLHIVGSGPDLFYFRSIADSDKRIMFHGFVSDEMLSRLYLNANILIVPSIWYEPFGLIILESFKHGTPVIGSRIGGIPELIKEGFNGFLFEPGNVNELVDLLRKIMININILKVLEQGATCSLMSHSIDVHIRNLRNIYIEVLN